MPEKEKHKEQLEFMVKSVVRTDTYLNYANTKSTILLSLSSATLATLAVNTSKFMPEIMTKMSWYIFSALVLISFLLMLTSMFLSIRSIRPYLNASEKENIMSFVDIIEHNKKPVDYVNKIITKDNLTLRKEIAYLNFNLANGLIGKYKKQRRAIDLFIASIITFLVAFIIIYAISAFNKNMEQTTYKTTSLSCKITSY